MNKKFLMLILVMLLFTFSLHGVNALNLTVPNVSPGMIYPDYWLQMMPDPNQRIMDQESIGAFNREIAQKVPGILWDLRNYPVVADQNTLSGWITAPHFPEEPCYIAGIAVPASYYQNLQQQMNLTGIKAQNAVRYAFTVRRTDIRTFPTGERIFDSPGDREFDLFQETALDPAEALLILHQSRDGQWFYVQAYNYRGWVNANDTAIVPSRQEWLDYQNKNPFLVVTACRLVLGVNPFSPELSQLSFQMGTRLPLVTENPPPTVDNKATDANYLISLPTRAADGTVQFKTALVPYNAGVHEGYLPYCRANIIRQAFQWEGQRYGWGGMFDSVDCSALVLNVYRTFGFTLPRNTGEQEQSAGRTVNLNLATIPERLQALRTLQPGAVLYMNGHEMLYLGETDQRFYVIHSLAGRGDSEHPKSDGTLNRIPVNQVIVSELMLKRANGKSFLESLTTGKQIEW